MRLEEGIDQVRVFLPLDNISLRLDNISLRLEKDSSDEIGRLRFIVCFGLSRPTHSIRQGAHKRAVILVKGKRVAFSICQPAQKERRQTPAAFGPREDCLLDLAALRN